MTTRTNKIVILHDYFNSADGGGRLCALYADSVKADLAYGFKTHDHPYFEVYKPGRCFDLRSYSSLPLLRQLKLLNTFKTSTQFVTTYNSALYSGSYSPLTLLSHAANRNWLYCHTPPRFLYDKREYYLTRSTYWKRHLLQRFINYFQPQYEASVSHMDGIITNSVFVKNRIKKYLNRTAHVIHPPCEIYKFTWKGQQKYYLSVARLDSLKQVELSIKAFLKMPCKKLVITSGGVELKRLKKLAYNAPNIFFTGPVSESRLHELIGNAIATIYLPVDEDFGMSPVESMASGKPVIGVASGGLLETVTHEETGLLLPPDFDTDQLLSAIQKMTPSYALKLRSACETRAELFTHNRFVNKMNAILDSH